MNKYRVYNLQTGEIICCFVSNADDWDGLLSCVCGFSKDRLPWQWELRKEVFGEWKQIMQKRSSPEYEIYLEKLPWWNRIFGIGNRKTFEQFVSIDTH